MGSQGGCYLASEPEESSTVEVEDAVRVLLQGLGEDDQREGLKKTPLRVAKAFHYGTRGYKQSVKDIVEGALFPEPSIGDEIGYVGGAAAGLVVVRDIDLFSYCETCLLPFSIRCHVGYVPSSQRVVGLSKLARVADVFAKRFQEPQRLADEICFALQESIRPVGVAIALECWHIQSPEAFRRSSTTINLKHPAKSGNQGWLCAAVCSVSGGFKDKNCSLSDDFLALLKLNGTTTIDNHCSTQSWCPSKRISSKPGTIQPAMIDAVATIIRSLGEEPSRKELTDAPYRFVHWLLNFQRSTLELNPNDLRKPSIVRNDDSDQHKKVHSELNLPFCSQCEHHLLPFYGVVHIGYFYSGGDQIVDRAVLQSLVHFYSFSLQVQERLTRQLADAVSCITGMGVIVVVEASHICMISRGIEKVKSSTATIATKGEFATKPVAKAVFLQAI